MFIDANALLGDPVSDLYGANGAEAMNGAGYIFQSFLEANELCVPATLGYHRGPHATWRHPRGHCLRRDHVVISSALKAVVSSFCVLSDFDGGFCHVDHWPAVLRPDRKPLRCNYDKIRDPDCIQRFQQSIQSLPVPSWEVSVGDHSKILETNIVQLGQQHFGQPSKIKQRPVLSEATLSGIKLKRQMLDMMRTCLPSDPLLVSELKAIEKILRPKVRHVTKPGGMTFGLATSTMLIHNMILPPCTRNLPGSAGAKRLWKRAIDHCLNSGYPRTAH